VDDEDIIIKKNEDCEASLKMMDGFQDDGEERKSEILDIDGDSDIRDSMNQLDK
jgi:hypothetical protein